MSGIGFEPVVEMPTSEWRKVIDVNLTGSFSSPENRLTPAGRD